MIKATLFDKHYPPKHTQNQRGIQENVFQGIFKIFIWREWTIPRSRSDSGLPATYKAKPARAGGRFV